MTHFLSERILLRADDGVVVVESLLQLRGRETHLLCESLTAVELLHQATADVVLAVPLDFLRRLSVENESNGVLYDKHMSYLAKRNDGFWRKHIPCRSPTFSR